MTVPHEFTLRDASRILTAPGPGDNKYTRGGVLLLTGSAAYPGAAVLNAGGSLAAGAGMVRYLGPNSVTSLVHHRHPEVIAGEGRSDAVILGSGIADASEDDRADSMRAALADEHQPTVVDAGGFHLLGPETETAACILTPHSGELDTLRERYGLRRAGRRAERARSGRSARAERDRSGEAQAIADESGAVVLLKGAATRIVLPRERDSGDGQAPTAGYLVTAPTHWAATAGTGDVLAGLAGAIIAQRAASATVALAARELAEGAATAAWVHAWATWVAARRAAGCAVTTEALLGALSAPSLASGPTGPVTASALADAIPTVVAAVNAL